MTEQSKPIPERWREWYSHCADGSTVIMSIRHNSLKAIIDELGQAEQERDQARAAVAKARKDALEEAAESMCQFCRREHGALPAKWNGKSWIHTKRTEESAGIVCSAQAIHALAAKDTQEGE